MTGPGLVSRNVGDNVRRLRWERGMSQKDLAVALRYAGIPTARQTTVSRIEHHQQTVSVDHLVALATALGATLQELLKGPR